MAAKKRTKKPAAKKGTYKGKSLKPGGGGRFQKCVDEVKASGAKDPKAVCAAAGRKKYGKKKFQKMAVTGRKRAAAKKRKK